MSENISTNTVFHFTRNIASIESILKNDFYPQCCNEDILGTIMNIEDANKFIPMVSFCDIPLSQIKKHAINYGDYAIGLTKDWAIKKKINPVIYTYQNSEFARNFKSAFAVLLNAEVKKKSPRKKMLDQFLIALQYVKPYEGRLWRAGKWTENPIRFYDEREWRYVPRYPDKEIPFWFDQDDIKSEHTLKELNKNLAGIDKVRLSFEPKDIKFIIVKKGE